LFAVQSLHFYPPDFDRFPCLRLAFDAARLGGTMPAVLNAANEIAVQAFLDGQIGFLGISVVIEQTMTRHDVVPLTDIATAMAADHWAREQAEVAVKGFPSSKLAL
jgi:1-deoxy-D-xylulose-5-phosphate reductoisomerase